MKKQLTQTPTTPREIVIIGGGYVGVHAYRSLMRRAGAQVRSGAIAITVIDPLTHHTFHGWSGETVGGVMADANRLSPLREVFPQARVLRGRVVRIDAARKSVAYRPVDGDRDILLPYDALVIGAGVGAKHEGVTGLWEHGLTLHGAGGPEAVRAHVIGTIERAEATFDPRERQRLLTYVIAGAGFTGVEVAAAIAELLTVLTPRYPVLREISPRVELVHAGGTVLPELAATSKLVAYANDSLKKGGVHLRFWTRLVEITADGAALSDGLRIPSATVISTIGTSIGVIPGTEGFARDGRNRIVVDQALRVPGADGVWAGGDNACVSRARDGRPTPPNAIWAIRHGQFIGRAIARSLTNRDIAPFNSPGLGQAASLGIGKGIMELWGTEWTGMTAWIVRLVVFLYYMPSRRVGLKALAAWTTLPIAGRTVTLGETTERPATERSVETDGLLALGDRFLRFGDLTGGWN